MDRADLRSQVSGQEREDVLPERLEDLLSLEPCGEPRLAGANPGLRLPRAVFLRRDEGRHQDEEQQHRRAPRGDRRRVAGRALPGILPGAQHPPLVLVHLRDDGADAVHRRLPVVGAHDRQSALDVTALAQLDGSRQLVHLHRQGTLQRLDALLLRRAVGSEAAQAGQLTRQRHLRAPVRLEVALLAHQQEAALSGLRVLGEREEDVEMIQHLHRPLHAVGRGVAGLHGAQGEERDQHHCEDRHCEPGEGVRGEPGGAGPHAFRQSLGLVHRRGVRPPRPPRHGVLCGVS